MKGDGARCISCGSAYPHRSALARGMGILSRSLELPITALHVPGACARLTGFAIQSISWPGSLLTSDPIWNVLLQAYSMTSVQTPARRSTICLQARDAVPPVRVTKVSPARSAQVLANPFAIETFRLRRIKAPADSDQTERVSAPSRSCTASGLSSMFASASNLTIHATASSLRANVCAGTPNSFSAFMRLTSL